MPPSGLLEVIEMIEQRRIPAAEADLALVAAGATSKGLLPPWQATPTLGSCFHMGWRSTTAETRSLPGSGAGSGRPRSSTLPPQPRTRLECGTASAGGSTSCATARAR